MEHRSSSEQNNSYKSFESLTPREIKRQKYRLNIAFKSYVFLGIVFHAIAGGLVILYLFFWWNTGYTLPLFLRFLVYLRIFLLLLVLVIPIDVTKIYGTGAYYKILRHFSYYPSLGAWLLIGFVDLYVFRYSILVFNFIYFALDAFNNFEQFFAYLFLDLLFLLDFYITLYIVYYLGVRHNVRDKLLQVKKKRRKVFV